jgi:hypothetical protein
MTFGALELQNDKFEMIFTTARVGLKDRNIGRCRVRIPSMEWLWFGTALRFRVTKANDEATALRDASNSARGFSRQYVCANSIRRLQKFRVSSAKSLFRCSPVYDD